jgi:5S rRNA maturation endonuclease (ribonuclease M5)
VLLSRARITDVRSVWGQPEDIPLGERVTVLVGLNRSGTSNVAYALAAAMDPTRPFRPPRDLPRGRRGSPRVELWPAEGGRVTVTWDPDSGTRHVDGRLAEGSALVCRVADRPRDVLTQADVDLDDTPTRETLAATITETAREIIPEIATSQVSRAGVVEVRDDQGSLIPVPEVRAIVALSLARHLAAEGTPPALVVVESPEAFLHPAGQAIVATRLVGVAEEIGAPVVVTTTSPFVIPRVAQTTVVGLARDAVGRTGVVGSATGDATQARILGGLLDDPGLANVLDRVGAIPPDTRGVLIVEGGTDEAYLEIAAERLGRPEVLRDIEVRPAGGAMAAAMSAIVLRAELDVAVVVLLDHDEQGRRARDTLTSRFSFDRSREVVTYADVFAGHPRGIEAETLFDIGLLRRFVRERGRRVSRGEQVVDGIEHVSLTSSGKSAFVGWAGQHADPEHLDRWGQLLDLLEERFPA